MALDFFSDEEVSFGEVGKKIINQSNREGHEGRNILSKPGDTNSRIS